MTFGFETKCGDKPKNLIRYDQKDRGNFLSQLYRINGLFFEMITSKQKKFHNESGYSLIEMVVAIMIIASISGAVIYNYTSADSSIKIKSLSKKILSDIRYAQEMALSHRKDVKFYIDTDNNSYSIKWQDNSYLPEPIGGQNFIFNINDSDFAGIDITSTGFSFGHFGFNSKGQPLNDGAVLSAETVLMRLNNQVQIIIVPGTGNCYLQE